MKNKTIFVFLAAILIAGAFALLRLHAYRVNRERALADLQRRNRGEESARRENQRLKTLVGQMQSVDPAASRSAEVEGARREVADLEARAAARHAALNAQAAAESAALGLNRDPERGMTRLEYFRDIGHTTPTAALQTLVWASLQGESKALAELLAVSPEGRAKADALLARLPAEGRAKFPNAESLAAIAVAGEILKGGSLEMMGCMFTDASHAIVQIRVPGGREAKLPMQRDADGWQLLVPDRTIDAIVRRKAEVVVESPGK